MAGAHATAWSESELIPEEPVVDEGEEEALKEDLARDEDGDSVVKSGDLESRWGRRTKQGQPADGASRDMFEPNTAARPWW